MADRVIFTGKALDGKVKVIVPISAKAPNSIQLMLFDGDGVRVGDVRLTPPVARELAAALGAGSV